MLKVDEDVATVHSKLLGVGQSICKSENSCVSPALRGHINLKGGGGSSVLTFEVRLATVHDEAISAMLLLVGGIGGRFGVVDNANLKL